MSQSEQTSAASTQGSCSRGLEAVHRFLQKRGFVVVTRDGCAQPGRSGYEAWAYSGPLDFSSAAPVRFGLGSDVLSALIALAEYLESMPASQSRDIPVPTEHWAGRKNHHVHTK
jgi:hypothetical protein